MEEVHFKAHGCYVSKVLGKNQAPSVRSTVLMERLVTCKHGTIIQLVMLDAVTV